MESAGPERRPRGVDALVRAEVDRLVTAVSAARRLPYRGSLPVRTVGRDAFRAEVASAVLAGVPSSGPAAEAPFLRRLGLIPPAADYARLVAKHFAGATVPIYDPDARRLLIPDFLPLDLETPVLPHEIAHAVADQKFGLRRLLQISPDGAHRLSGDAERARLALVEGDAALAALEVADPRETFLGARELRTLTSNLREAADDDRSPSWLLTLGRFAHVDGLTFVARVRARQPWSAVDRLWSDPPASTEQVLHPEKYDTCDEPVPVDETLLPTLPGLGRPTATAVLGELVIRSWLAKTLPPELAERAAAGWGGDRAAIYGARPEPPEPDLATGERKDSSPAGAAAEPAFAWLTIWDDASEAEDFARAVGAASPEAILARRGEAVALLFGVVDDPPSALSDMLEGWRREQAPKRGPPRRSPLPGRCASSERPARRAAR